MKLTSLHIDRFGARSQLSLSDISEGLNVVYGPNGAGKTTIIQFVRWMLFGTQDEVSRRYLTSGSAPSKGSLQVSDGGRLRTIERSYGGYSSAAPSSPTINGLTASEFDRCFCVSFDRQHDVSELLRSATSNGYQLRYDQRQLDRIEQLTHEINRHRDELNRLSFVEATVESLRTRRETHRREIDSIRHEFQSRRDDLERQRQQAHVDVCDQQAIAERLRQRVQSVEASIQARRQQLAGEYRQWTAARSETIERRNRRVEEIDRQISRWQEILSEVLQRLENVRAQIAEVGDVAVGPTESTDMRFFLKTLGFRIRDIEQDLSTDHQHDGWQDYESDANYLRGFLGSAMNSVRDDVSRLAQAMERHQFAAELRETRDEITYLSHVERDLRGLLEALNRQRRELMLESEFFPSEFASESTLYVLEDQQANIPMDVLASLKDFRLRSLFDRCEGVTSQSQEADAEFLCRQNRLRDVEAQIARLSEDSRIALLQREISDMDATMQQIQQRDALQRTISSLEDEYRRLQQAMGKSDVVNEAAAILARLTDSEYSTLHVTEDHRCQVTQRDGQKLDYTQLSRGVRDQVYLSLCMALVSAYHRRGVEATLILNDAFSNLDNSGTRALSRILLDVARKGHQILVFTRHQHIHDLLQPGADRVFTLRHVDEYDVPSTERYLPPVATIDYATRGSAVTTPIAEMLPTPDPTYRWIAEWQRNSPPTPIDPKPTIAPVREPDPQPIDPPEPEESDAGASTLLSVQESSHLEDVPTLGEELITLLKGVDIEYVGQFIDSDPDDLAVQLEESGLSAEVILRRQREILMLIYVAVSPLESQLLVACGVPDPERLGRADEEVLLRRIETILERPQAITRFGSISEYSLPRIRGWIETARQSHYKSSTPKSFFGGSTNGIPRDRSPRSRTRTERASNRNSDKSRQKTVRMDSSRNLRFYLEMKDPVVDAPSIGPKTAERLHEIDIYTVADLLDASPADIAARLDDKRISTETVEQWQLQSELVCRIPNLRGHDAQILVACEIRDPADLASLDASTFLKRVSEFVDTKDGQRIIRGGKRPDLAEVTAWIEWSESARQLRAA